MKVEILRAIFIGILISALVTIPVLAHDWPSNINDWSDDDWNAWWDQAWYHNNHEREREWEREERAREERERRERERHDNCDYNRNYNYSYNNYSGYNYYSGILDVADGSTEDQAMVLARIINYYAHGVASQTAQAGVGWAVMNAVDITGGNSNVCTVAPNYYYDYSANITDDFGRNLLPLARDILLRWKAGRAGISNNGRVLPSGYWCIFSNGVTITFGTDAYGGGRAIETFGYGSPYGN